MTYQSFPLQLPVPINCEGIDIEQVVQIFKRMNSISESLAVRVYDPVRDRYIDLRSQEMADRAYMYSPVVMIKYRASASSE